MGIQSKQHFFAQKAKKSHSSPNLDLPHAEAEKAGTSEFVSQIEMCLPVQCSVPKVLCPTYSVAIRSILENCDFSQVSLRFPPCPLEDHQLDHYYCLLIPRLFQPSLGGDKRDQS